MRTSDGCDTMGSERVLEVRVRRSSGGRGAVRERGRERHSVSGVTRATIGGNAKSTIFNETIKQKNNETFPLRIDTSKSLALAPPGRRAPRSDLTT